MHCHNHLVEVALSQFFLKLAQIVAHGVAETRCGGIHGASTLKHGVGALLVAEGHHGYAALVEVLDGQFVTLVFHHGDGGSPQAVEQRGWLGVVELLRYVEFVAWRG